jgi:uncharacterized membrane protein
MTLGGKSKVVSWLLDFHVQALTSIVMPGVLSPRLETQGRMLAVVLVCLIPCRLSLTGRVAEGIIFLMLMEEMPDCS